MSSPEPPVSPGSFNFDLVRPRAQMLARADRELKAQLVRMRIASGLTQQQLADRMGVSQQAVNKFERYDSDPKLSTLRRYENAVEAIVEHRVTRDAGQSLAIASSTRWDAVATQTLPAPIVLRPRTRRASWVSETRTLLALVS